MANTKEEVMKSRVMTEALKRNYGVGLEDGAKKQLMAAKEVNKVDLVALEIEMKYGTTKMGKMQKDMDDFFDYFQKNQKQIEQFKKYTKFKVPKYLQKDKAITDAAVKKVDDRRSKEERDAIASQRSIHRSKYNMNQS